MHDQQAAAIRVASGFSQMRILVSSPIFFPDHLTKLSNIFMPKPHITTALVYCGPEVHLLNICCHILTNTQCTKKSGSHPDNLVCG